MQTEISIQPIITFTFNDERELAEVHVDFSDSLCDTGTYVDQTIETFTPDEHEPMLVEEIGMWATRHRSVIERMR